MPDVVSRTDHYAYGSPMPRRNFPGNDRYRFGYQGSEADDEFRGESVTINTFYRSMDTRIGRWISVDPVVQPYQSPYCSMDNNPVVYNDPHGDKVKYKDGKSRRAARRARKSDPEARAAHKKLKDDRKHLHIFRNGDKDDPDAATRIKEVAAYEDPDKHDEIGSDNGERGENVSTWSINTDIEKNVRIRWSGRGVVDGARQIIGHGFAGPVSVNIPMFVEGWASVILRGQPETLGADYLIVNGAALQTRRMQLPNSTTTLSLAAAYVVPPDVEPGRNAYKRLPGASPLGLSNADGVVTIRAHFSIHATSNRMSITIPQGFMGMPAWRKARKPDGAEGDEFRIVR